MLILIKIGYFSICLHRESSRKKLKENKIKLTKVEDENTKVSSELAKTNATIESSKSSLIPYEKKLHDDNVETILLNLTRTTRHSGYN